LSEAEYQLLTQNWLRPLRRHNDTERQLDRRMHLFAELALHKRRLNLVGVEQEPELPEQIALIRAKLLT